MAVCAFGNLHFAGAKPVRPTVVVFGVDRHSEFADEAIHRLQGELRAAGYEPLLRLLADLQNVEAQFASAAADKSVAAVFVLREGSIEQTAEFLLWQPGSQRQQQRSIDLSQEPPVRAARLLAIRVAEFLRSQTAILPPAEAQPQATALAPEPPTARFVPTIAPELAVGVSVLTEAFVSSQMGVSTNAGLIRTLSPNASLILRASWFGQVAGGALIEPEAQSEIARQMFCLEFGAARMVASRVSAFALASVGAHRLAATAEVQPGFVARNRVAWSALGGGQVGARIRLNSIFSLETNVGLLALTSAPDVFIADRRVQTFGRPTLLAGLSMVGTL